MFRKAFAAALATGVGLAAYRSANPASCATQPPFLHADSSSSSARKNSLNTMSGAQPPFPQDFDVVVVGGGIVGLATAREIALRFPKKKIVVLEKEKEIASHQTGHNSGVIHAGIYYKPGSAMAICCVNGARKMYEYCEKSKIPHDRCGKLIVATNEKEHEVLEKLLVNGTANGVEGLRLLTGAEVREIEPNVVVHSALLSPNTGVVDFAAVARSFARDLVKAGGEVKVNFEATDFRLLDDGRVEIKGREIGQNGPTKVVRAKNVITCAGLQSDRVAAKAGGSRNPKILPFRGTYYEMKPEYRNIVKRNIYPVPSGGGIAVGVHFTPTVNEQRGQQMIIGPGACLAFSREGYKFFDFSLKDMLSTLGNYGLWRFAVSNWDLAFGEMYRDLNKRAFLAQAKKLVPSITEDMIQESFSGVMAQVFNDDGKAASDFIYERNLLNGTTLHVRNAPSPACTASLAIAENVVNTATEDFKWTTN